MDGNGRSRGRSFAVVQGSGLRESTDVVGIEVELFVIAAVVDRLRNRRSWCYVQLGSLQVCCDPMRSVAIVLSSSALSWCAEVSAPGP